MIREHSILVQAVARKHPTLPEQVIAKVLIDAADELHTELVTRSLEWRESKEPGAIYRESEARACASLVFALGEVN